MKAVYVLIKADLQRVHKIALQIRKLCEDITVTAGHYDIIVRIKIDHTHSQNEIIEKIRTLPGVLETVILPTIEN